MMLFMARCVVFCCLMIVASTAIDVPGSTGVDMEPDIAVERFNGTHRLNRDAIKKLHHKHEVVDPFMERMKKKNGLAKSKKVIPEIDTLGGAANPMWSEHVKRHPRLDHHSKKKPYLEDDDPLFKPLKKTKHRLPESQKTIPEMDILDGAANPMWSEDVKRHPRLDHHSNKKPYLEDEDPLFKPLKKMKHRMPKSQKTIPAIVFPEAAFPAKQVNGPPVGNNPSKKDHHGLFHHIYQALNRAKTVLRKSKEAIPELVKGLRQWYHNYKANAKRLWNKLKSVLKKPWAKINEKHEKA